MKTRLEKNLKARKNYLKKLNKVREGNFIEINNFKEKYGL